MLKELCGRMRRRERTPVEVRALLRRMMQGCISVLAIGLLFAPAYAAEGNIFADGANLVGVTAEPGTWSSGAVKGSVKCMPDGAFQTTLTDGVINDAIDNRVVISPGSAAYSDFDHAAVLTFQLKKATELNRLVFYAGAGEIGSSNVNGLNADLKALNTNSTTNRNDDLVINTHQDALIPSKIQVRYSLDGEKYSVCEQVTHENLVYPKQKYQKLILHFDKIETVYLQIRILGGCGSGSGTAKNDARIREIEAYCTDHPRKVPFTAGIDSAPPSADDALKDKGYSRFTKKEGQSDAEALFERLTDGKTFASQYAADSWLVNCPGKLVNEDGTVSLPYVTFGLGEEAQPINTLRFSAGDDQYRYQSEWVDPTGVHLSYTEDGTAWKTINLSNMQVEDAIDLDNDAKNVAVRKRQSLTLRFSTVHAKAMRIMITKGTGRRAYAAETGEMSFTPANTPAAFRLHELTAYYDKDRNIPDAFAVTPLYPVEVHAMTFQTADGGEKLSPADGATLTRVICRKTADVSAGAVAIVSVSEDDSVKGVKLQPIPNTVSGDGTFEIIPELAVNADSDVRVFVWDSADSLKPITRGYHAVPKEKVNLYLVGSSNADAGLAKTLAELMDADAVTVNTDDCSDGGNTAELIDSGKLKELQSKLGYGDYVLFELAKGDWYRKTTQAGTAGSYQENLSYLIDAVRAQGGIPMLATPVSRKTAAGYDADYDGFIAAMKQIGTEKHVPVLDAAGVSKSSLDALDPTVAESYYSADGSALTESGVRWLSGLLRAEVKQQGIPLPLVSMPENPITESSVPEVGAPAVSKENFDLYLAIGQSNMAGRAPIEERDQMMIPNVYLLNGDDAWETAQAQFVETKWCGMNRYSTVRNQAALAGLSPAFYFAKTLAETVGGENKKIGIISNARGDTTVAQWQKDYQDSEGYDSARDFKLYEEAVRRARKAMETGTLKGIIWHQGCANQKYPNTYPGYFKKLAEDLRADLGIPDLPIIIGEIPAFGSTDEIIAYRQTFNEKAIRVIPTQVENCWYVSSEGCGDIGDKTHFNAAAQRVLGKRYAEAALEHIYH